LTLIRKKNKKDSCVVDMHQDCPALI